MADNSRINVRNVYIELLNKMKAIEGVDIEYIDHLVQLLYDDINLIDIDVETIKALIPNTATTSNMLATMSDLPAAQVNSDWNAVSGVAQILNKPTIPAAQVNSDWNAVSGVAQILNKPTIPAAQVNSDWNASSGVAAILNKPPIINVAFEELEITTNMWSQVIGQTYYEAAIALTDITSYVDIPAILCDRGNNTQYSLITDVITSFNSGVGYVTLTLRSNTLPTTTINAGVYVFTH